MSISPIAALALRRAAEGKMDGAQIHVLSYLGATWGMGSPRFSTEQAVSGGAISQPFLDQLAAVGKALGSNPPR